MIKTTVKANAKINLFLLVEQNSRTTHFDVPEPKFHNIKSVLQEISLYDTIEITKLDDGSDAKIKFHCSHPSLNDHDNLCVKAAEKFFCNTNINACIQIDLCKNIPVCAGLGGGSSDAAAVLKALNDMFNTKLSSAQLESLASELGSDVPFFIQGGTQIATGTGTVLSPIIGLNFPILVIPGKDKISTKKAYELIDEQMIIKSPSFCKFTEAVKNNDSDYVFDNLFNSFESLYDLRQIKKMLNKCRTSLLCGAGSSVFAIYKTLDDAVYEQKQLSELGINSFLCETVI